MDAGWLDEKEAADLRRHIAYMRESYKSWLVNQNCCTPIAPERLAEMFSATCKYGSGNCWTGTAGMLSGYVRELLREVEHLRAERNSDD